MRDYLLEGVARNAKGFNNDVGQVAKDVNPGNDRPGIGWLPGLYHIYNTGHDLTVPLRKPPANPTTPACASGPVAPATRSPASAQSSVAA